MTQNLRLLLAYLIARLYQLHPILIIYNCIICIALRSTSDITMSRRIHSLTEIFQRIVT